LAFAAGRGGDGGRYWGLCRRVG